MIAQQASQLADLAVSLRDAGKQQEIRSQFDARLRALETSTNSLRRAQIAWIALRDSGIVRSADVPEGIDGAARSVAALRNQAAQDESVLLGAQFAIANDLIGKTVQALDIVSKAAWIAFCNGSAPSAPPAVLDVLRRRPDLAPNIDKLRQVTKELEGLRDGPITAASVSRGRLLAGQIQGLSEQLVGTNVPPAVTAYLQLAAQGRATLADLAPSVFEWLRDQGVLHAFNVRFG